MVNLNLHLHAVLGRASRVLRGTLLKAPERVVAFANGHIASNNRSTSTSRRKQDGGKSQQSKAQQALKSPCRKLIQYYT